MTRNDNKLTGRARRLGQSGCRSHPGPSVRSLVEPPTNQSSDRSPPDVAGHCGLLLGSAQATDSPRSTSVALPAALRTAH